MAIDNYNLLPNITVHPPFLSRELHSNTEAVQHALISGNIFLNRLGRLIEDSGINAIIGVENMSALEASGHALMGLGYKLDHLTQLVTGTNSKIQFTVDRGHQNLTEHFNVDDLVNWCRQNHKYITNFHFHGNGGYLAPIRQTIKGASPSAESYFLTHINQLEYDTHWIPQRGQGNGYSAYIIRAVAENIPLDLELNARRILRANGPQALVNFLEQLRTEIRLAYELFT